MTASSAEGGQVSCAPWCGETLVELDARPDLEHLSSAYFGKVRNIDRGYCTELCCAIERCEPWCGSEKAAVEAGLLVGEVGGRPMVYWQRDLRPGDDSRDRGYCSTECLRLAPCFPWCGTLLREGGLEAPFSFPSARATRKDGDVVACCRGWCVEENKVRRHEVRDPCYPSRCSACGALFPDLSEACIVDPGWRARVQEAQRLLEIMFPDPSGPPSATPESCSLMTDFFYHLFAGRQGWNLNYLRLCLEKKLSEGWVPPLVSGGSRR